MCKTDLLLLKAKKSLKYFKYLKYQICLDFSTHTHTKKKQKNSNTIFLNIIFLVCPAIQTHCDPIDCSPPGSSDLGILQVRILEWVAIPFFRGSSRPQPRDQTCISCIPTSSHCKCQSITYFWQHVHNLFLT